jgi:exosortase
MQGPALDLRGPWLACVVLLGLLTWLFWDFLATNYRWAIQQQADWGHTLVIPFIAGYFIYLSRDKLLAQPFKTEWFGLVPMVLGVAWYMTCTLGPMTIRHHNLQGAGVGLTLGGLALLFCGWRAMIWLWFPLVYLVLFGQFISERFLHIVTYQLQDITARGAYFILALFFDVQISGNTITLFDDGVPKPLNIAEACSGMRMLMAFLALGVAMAYTGLKHRWQQIALVLLAVPTAIFVNVLRVVTLGLLSLMDSNLAAGDFHSFVGLVWLVPAFMMYLGLIWILRHTVVDVQASTGSSPDLTAPADQAVPACRRMFGRHAKFALVIACMTLAGSALDCSYGR